MKINMKWNNEDSNCEIWYTDNYYNPYPYYPIYYSWKYCPHCGACCNQRDCYCSSCGYHFGTEYCPMCGKEVNE